MKFHHHGYVSTNPRRKAAAGIGLERWEAPEAPHPDMPQNIDVLIVGAGPAGMMTAASLSVYDDINAVLIDKRPHRLILGQADGIQARSVETFQAFGFRHEIVDEAYQITETAFWNDDPDNPGNIIRTGWTIDDEHGISEFEHIIVNQARVLDYFAEFMYNQPSRMRPHYGWEFLDLEVGAGSEDYPVRVKLRGSGEWNKGEEVSVNAKYVVGTDGATSGVRRCIGATHTGKISYHAWGVADVIARTDFPDIHTKCIIHSKAGSSLHIPREGGYLFRSYIDLGEVAEDDNHKIRQTPLEEILKKCNEIFHPYTIDVQDTAWWSVYEVAHRVTQRFDDVLPENRDKQDPRVFIEGDACHTHSAKAGQGMNVSMQDGFNLGWKLGQVLRGYSSPSLLHTYNGERQQIAQDLIDFDLEWSARMADPEGEGIEEFYLKTAEFPAGFMTEYPVGLLISGEAKQELATGYPLGKRFKSVEVTRRNDANYPHLGHLHQADGRWRIYVFADQASPKDKDSKVAKFATWLEKDPASPLVRHTRPGDDADTLFDIKVIYQQHHHDFEVTDAPAVFRPKTGPFQIEDWNQVFSVHPEIDIFDERGISRDGAVVVVRPDMYVAHITSLEDTESLTNFFDPIFDLSANTPAAARPGQ
ncbi:FAD-dependent monooxygenase [Trueperella abortisuis]|uniref:Phenol 2-monooxygenase n=1 Tax=Trueperella abortisuis TaxID=445930 RepID=A0ABT9PFN3_9ACTO|nr:FAD-dependent monooxygenase [Trueperella abortisuis]MDP9831518.1 phenol 2-monooxygenase [Trueperella abortisuis]